MSRGLWSMLVVLTWFGCTSREDDETPATAPQDAIFEEVATHVGLDFIHDNGMQGKFRMDEIMGSGGALFDYDGDGDLDVYLSQTQYLDIRPERAQSGRLYRNALIPSGELRFEDVTDAAGLALPQVNGMGAAVGDVNGDGLPDLYLTNYGPNRLMLNLGDGAFADVTETAQAGDDRWSVSAAFLDYDRDGMLDLFIANYVDLRPETVKDCFFGRLDYCDPSAYRPEPDRLLRNRGDGSFEDVTVSSGVVQAFGSGLGVVAADLNGDGLTDLYVANDGNPNQAWINQGDGRFVDTALMAGAALNHSGAAEAGMGVDAADFDGDGDEDLFVTHLAGQTNTIYVNDGRGNFEDRTIQTGLGTPSTPFTGFGAAWFDYDNDGLLDLFAVNGAVTALANLPDDPFPYHQTNQLFHNLDGGRFEDRSQDAGLVRSEVSRGALFGDVDNDGDTDVIVTNNHGPVRLLRNRVGADNAWLGLDLRLADGRAALNARVEIRQKNRSLWRRVARDGSYASAKDPRIIVGLGDDRDACTLIIHWPDGATQTIENLAVDRYHRLTQETP